MHAFVHVCLVCVYIYIYILACIYSVCIRLITRKQVRARAHAYTHVRMHARTKTALKKNKKNSKRGRPPKIEKNHFKTKIDARSLWFWVNLNAQGASHIYVCILEGKVNTKFGNMFACK